MLSHDVKVTSFPAVATGTSTITGTAVDMAGFEGAMFIVRLGSPSTTNNIRVSQCDTVGGTYADLTGTLVGNHATDTPLVVDVVRTKEQFLKYVVTRGTGTTIGEVTVIQYGARTRPTTQPSGTQVETFINASEGTA